jgi:general secretion pathway protein E
MSTASVSCPDNLEDISAEVLAELRGRAQTEGRSVMELMEERWGITPTEALARLGRTLRLSTIGMDELHGLQPDFRIVPYAEGVRRKCVVGNSAEGQPLCVIADPFDLALQGQLEARLPDIPEWRLAHPADLRAFFSLMEEGLRAIDGVLDSVSSDDADGSGGDDLSLVSIAEDASPVVRLVNSTVLDAMKAGASDIHLESFAQGLHVKYRIDGVLSLVATVPGVEMAEQTVSRIKVMAELDISERRVPQDGRFKLSVKGREIDFRVSVMPSLFAEDVVVRILDKRTLADQIQGLRLDLLGFEPAILGRIRRLAREPYGMFLVTGPTGSGKTTTLYAAVTEINTGRDKIVTIEDPVEYQLPGILQIPVNEKKGLTFARGLRSILRHDPDKILVGEIRDPDTAQIAVQSALTGHLVFTSVHANNVFDVLGRFLHMGVDTHSFVSALNGILAQRLMRIVCPECSTVHEPTSEELENVGITRESAAGMRLRRGRGCGHCRGTGYKGRHAIGELLRMNDELRELIVGRAPIRVIKEAARASGTTFLRDAALALAAAGKTTLEEVDRVTFAG